MKRLRELRFILAAFCIVTLIAVAISTANMGGTSGPVGNNNGQYNIEQTISDQAQRDTIAFDALAFLTGDACSDTFLPPGKVADYAGFQYLRDNDATQMGHNTDFVTRAADNVLYILNSDQLAQFMALSKAEAPLSSQYAYMRFPLMNAFRTNLDETLPAGSSVLDKSAVMNYSAQLYDVDASISIDRAKTYATVIRSLNTTQKAYLDKMTSEGMQNWPVVDVSDVLKNSGQDNSVAMRTYASEMFAWYKGSVASDVYFCPERQATYFGSFYMKDGPAIGNMDYSISTTLTGDSGESFLALLNDTQREKITGLVDLQRSDLNEIVAKRQAIATELRRALNGENIDENLVRSLSARYGELDGEISYYYATHFTDVKNSLTSDQKQKTHSLRDLGGLICSGAYLYSQPISMPPNVPSDFLFGVGKYSASKVSAWLQSLQTLLPTNGPTLKPPVQPSLTTTITNIIKRITNIPSTISSGLQRPTQTQKTQVTQNTGSQVSHNQPPTEAILSCKGKKVGDKCQFNDRQGNVTGTCDDKPGVLACAPSRDQGQGQDPASTKPVTTSIKSQTTPTIKDQGVCINNTKDNPECKDCCDCLIGADSKARTMCRDTCAIHDFSKNSNFITVSAPSVLGPDGDYSVCVEKGSSNECKVCCENSIGLQCGDYRYCRTACNDKFGDTQNTSVLA